MVKRYLPPAIFMLLGLWGLVGYGTLSAYDGDPHLYYITAGRVLGRTTIINPWILSPTDPLYEEAMARGEQFRVKFNAMVPYRDFISEYPPLTLPAFLIPRLCTDSVGTYYILFSAEMAIPAIGLWWVYFRIAQLLRPGKPMLTFCCGAWAVWVWASGRVLLHRFDMLVVFSVALATLNILRYRWGRAGIWLGIGMALKVYPIFLILPVVILAFGEGRWRAMARVLAGIIFIPVLSHVVLIPWTGLRVFEYFAYHSARGIEIESLWTPLIFFFANPGGDSVWSTVQFGCNQLASTRDLHPWITASYVAMIVTNLACGLIALRSIAMARVDRAIWSHRVIAIILSAITFAVVTAKVLSIQYVFWLFPMVMILPGKKGMGIAIAYVAALVLGHLWYPDYWSIITALTTQGMILVLARDTLLMLIAIAGCCIAARSRGGITESVELPAHCA